ncbi:MAG: HD domain-containing protein [Nitriliruptorales bacterium]|nr:HD domain-containing protein [Nitriliruptorales bacterium]
MTTELALFVVAAAIGELLPFPKPRGRDLSISVAVVAASALLGHAVVEVLAVAAGGWAVAAVLRAAQGRSLPLTNLWVATLGALALAGAVAVGRSIPLPELRSGMSVGALAGVWAVILLALPAYEAVSRAGSPARLASSYRTVVRQSAGGAVALASSASLGAIAHGVLGMWSVPLVLFPLLAARVGLARYTQVRVTYDQTVRAMSRLPEELGTVRRGHGVRVGDLAVAVARELGLADAEVTEIERAAHLHELGQIRADLGQPLADRTVALAGASILREAGSLDDVAALVERHRDPYRLAGVGDNAAVSMGARIVRSVCEFDRAAVDVPDGDGWQAIEALHQRSAYEHDPRVLRALTAVLHRQDRLGVAEVRSHA